VTPPPSPAAPSLEVEPNPLRDGIARRLRPEPCAVVLFGASGDLTRRKLIPALYNLARGGLLPEKVAIIGFARRPKTDEAFRAEMLAAVREHARTWVDGDPFLEEFGRSLHYHAGTFEDPAGYRGLADRLRRLDREHGLPGNRLHYLATAPEHFAVIAKQLGDAGIARPGGPPANWVRVVVEKPFGHDLESARALNRELREVLDEGQIFRIDHYLGKETVQNILALRFSNEIFEPLWNQKYVSHVQITVAETVGVEGRGGYYDGAGAIRDMVQNHMLQVLSLVAMEPPVAMEADAIRDEKLKVLKAIRRIPPREVDSRVVRARYGRGSILGRDVPAYTEEEGVPPESSTETYVALRLDIDSWRWAGVPFFLRAGKRLPKRSTEICIQFRKPPLRLFEADGPCAISSNALIINVQPDEGISLRFGAKVPGPALDVRQVKMDFRYGSSFGIPTADAYERLLLDAMAGDSTLFTRGDEVEAAWAFVDGIVEGWAGSGRPPLVHPAGTWGPEEADGLFEGTDGCWRRL
jgi:glucose-6-phosphate 1-dehydrogenase